MEMMKPTTPSTAPVRRPTTKARTTFTIPPGFLFWRTVMHGTGYLMSVAFDGGTDSEKLSLQPENEDVIVANQALTRKNQGCEAKNPSQRFACILIAFLWEDQMLQ